VGASTFDHYRTERLVMAAAAKLVSAAAQISAARAATLVECFVAIFRRPRRASGNSVANVEYAPANTAAPTIVRTRSSTRSFVPLSVITASVGATDDGYFHALHGRR
jgi:hypothetical protein